MVLSPTYLARRGQVRGQEQESLHDNMDVAAAGADGGTFTAKDASQMRKGAKGATGLNNHGLERGESCIKGAAVGSCHQL